MTEHQSIHHIDTVDIQDNSTIQERHPDWPELDISFYFGPHGHADNFKDVPARIAEADIYLYENVGTTGIRHDLQEVSKNPYGPVDDIVNEADIGEQPVNGTVWEPIIRSIYGTGKAVSSFDLRGSTKFRHMIDDTLHKHPVDTIHETFEKSIAALEKDVSAWADVQSRREDIMVDRFEGEIDYIFKNYPHLKEKSHVNVLITMGSIHTTLRHKMADKGIASSREFTANAPYVYSFNMELLRTYMYDRTPSQDLLEQAWTEGKIISLIEATHQEEESYYEKNYDTLAIYIRDLVAQLNHTQREQIYQLVKQAKEGRIADMETYYYGISDILKENGGHGLANNPEEMNEQIQAIQHLSAKGLVGHVRRFRSV